MTTNQVEIELIVKAGARRYEMAMQAAKINNLPVAEILRLAEAAARIAVVPMDRLLETWSTIDG